MYVSGKYQLQINTVCPKFQQHYHTLFQYMSFETGLCVVQSKHVGNKSFIFGVMI